jgi:hypothetical protein
MSKVLSDVTNVSTGKLLPAFRSNLLRIHSGRPEYSFNVSVKATNVDCMTRWVSEAKCDGCETAGCRQARPVRPTSV